ncbi:hypothetical protein PF008_g17879 [Phytophthora fragariae]|uniref:Uncharacterized protein n=1 Tax=Phytophthora fragariae TaxID=53985 RepID=A0A6G0R6Z5_9STRA|nr:hypothetical protein PF008_g17879 [Phytophthora fragariae]
MNLIKTIAHLAIIAAAMGSLAEAGWFSQKAQHSNISKGPVAPKPPILAPATFAPIVTPAPTTSADTDSLCDYKTTYRSADSDSFYDDRCPIYYPGSNSSFDDWCPCFCVDINSCSDDRGRNASAHCDSDGHHWRLDRDTGADCDFGGHPDRYAEPNHTGDAGSDSCSDDRGRNASAHCDSGGHHWRLDRDTGADCNHCGYDQSAGDYADVDSCTYGSCPSRFANFDPLPNDPCPRHHVDSNSSAFDSSPD